MRFIRKGGEKKKKTRDTQPTRGSSSSKQRDTSNIPEAAVLFHPRHDCSSSTTVSFFLSFILSLPFSFFLFFPPQHPCSLWGTHYRCSFHVISESHSRHLGRLYKRDDYRSVVEPGFFLPFLFFPLFISRFATYQNPFEILIRQILIRYWINVHNESFFFWFCFLFLFIGFYICAQNEDGGREYNFREN